MYELLKSIQIQTVINHTVLKYSQLKKFLCIRITRIFRIYLCLHVCYLFILTEGSEVLCYNSMRWNFFSASWVIIIMKYK